MIIHNGRHEAYRPPFLFMQTPTLLLPHFLRLAPEQPVSSEREELRGFIDDTLESRLGHKIDDEKLFALERTEKNVLSDSCAGGGKTELLLYKLFLLTKKENMNLNKIIVLSFNKTVAQMIKERAKRQFGINDCSAMTIHSLAHKILQPKKPILYDRKDGRKALSLYVRGIIRQYMKEIGFRYSYWQLLRLTKLVLQFISRMKKTCMMAEQLKMNSGAICNEKAKALTKIAVVLFRRYEHKMQSDGILDFDQLLVDATKHIHATKGDCFIRGMSTLKSLKHVLIDEFQDTSPLSFNLIQAIRKYNPGLRLFAVGDPRQCIYGFAGSDLYYFKNFENIFEDSTVCHLTVNRRSKERIVKHANTQYPHSRPMQYVRHKDKGAVEMIDIEKADRNVVAKQCGEIIKRTSGSVLILVRTNRAYGISIEKFQELIIGLLSGDSSMGIRNVQVSTVHSAKGMESDAVIILKSKNSFPLQHPDNTFYEAFNITDEEVLAEESRLWYVALTRAKGRLFVINSH